MKRWIIRPRQKLTADLLKYEQEAKIEEIRKRMLDILDGDTGVLYGLDLIVLEDTYPDENTRRFKIKVGPGAFIQDGEVVFVPDENKTWKRLRERETIDGTTYYFDSTGNIIDVTIDVTVAEPDPKYLYVRKILVEKRKNIVENGYALEWDFSDAPGVLLCRVSYNLGVEDKRRFAQIKKELLDSQKSFRDALKVDSRRVGTRDETIPYFDRDRRLYIDHPKSSKTEDRAYIESTADYLKFYAPRDVVVRKRQDTWAQTIYHDHTTSPPYISHSPVRCKKGVLTEKSLQRPIDYDSMSFIEKENNYRWISSVRNYLIISLPETTFASDIAIVGFRIYDRLEFSGEFSKTYSVTINVSDYFGRDTHTKEVHTIFSVFEISDTCMRYTIEREDYPPYDILVKITIRSIGPNDFWLYLQVLLKKV